MIEQSPKVLISGAGIGIGRACSHAFAAAGYHVIVTDILEDEGHAVVAEIEAEGGTATFQALDVTDSAAVDAMVQQHGPLDVLVCNAGIALKLPLDTLTDVEWDTTLDVNLKGMMRLIRAASQSMRDRKSGAIVCIASVVGHKLGWDEHIPYAASKGGIAGMVRAVAIELAKHGIRCNGIAPGVIRSAQTLDPINSVGEDGLSAFAPLVPLGRVGTPEDIAYVAVFLASEKARYLTGQILTVDGGLTASL